MNKIRMISIACCIFLMSIGSVYGYFDENTNDHTLKGIREVKIKVAIGDAVINQINATRANEYEIRNDVEYMIRQAGIRINHNADSEIFVSIIISDIDKNSGSIRGVYGGTHIEVRQHAQLIRNKNIVAKMMTWTSIHYFLIGPPDNFFQRCRLMVRDQIVEFLNAHAKANSR